MANPGAIHYFPVTGIHACKNITEPKFYNVHNEKLAKFMKTEKTRLAGQKLDTEFNKYSYFNRNIYEAKLPHINPYPMEEYYLEHRHEL